MEYQDTDDGGIPYGLGPKRCAVCSSKAPLLACGGCRVVHYCGAAHQSADRPRHKAACVAIRKSRERLEYEEAALRAHPGDAIMPADVFNTRAGSFWGIYGTRDYMTARFHAADALLKVDTAVAVEAALAHLTDMLRLNRGDNQGLRDIVPGLLLRLGREQECYDFLKWWAVVDDEDHYNGRYNWGDLTLPYLDIRGVDAFESVDKCRGTSLSHLAILTLLKLRIRLDLEQLERRDDPFDDYDPAFCRPLGSIVRARMGDPRLNVSATAAAVKRQYHELCRVVNDVNPHFWDLLVDDETPVLPPYYSPGSVEQAQMSLYQCQAAWRETEDADVMIDSDTVKFTSVYKGRLPNTGGGDTQWHGRENLARRPGTNTDPYVLALHLEQKPLFDAVHGSLFAQITSKAKKTEQATTEEAALAILGREPPPSVIFVADGAITRQRKVREAVIDRLRGGATVVLAGSFSSMVTMGQFDRFFARLGLPWERGSYERTTVSLSPTAVNGQLAARLPSGYSQKALFVKNVAPSAAWYTSTETSGQAAVAFAKVGLGRLGYVGDVNAEESSDTVILAMCGLLG